MAKHNLKNKKQSNETRRSNRVASLKLHKQGEIFKMAKAGTQKTVKIEGKDYTFQHPGVREFVRIQDRIKDDNGHPSNEKFAEEIFKHVAVEPKVNWNYFEENEGYEEFMSEAGSFLRSGK